jgi:hypothetical protein
MPGATRFSERFCKYRRKGTSNKLHTTNKGEGTSGITVYWEGSGRHTFTPDLRKGAIGDHTKNCMDNTKPTPV